MTCFWRGIIAEIDSESFKNIFGYTKSLKTSPEEFINLLKSQAVLTSQVKWNGSFLTHKEMKENFEHIKSLDTRLINQGYDCSSCDPVLLLICQLSKRNIEHNYLQKYLIKYQHANPTIEQPLCFASNQGHFWNTGKRKT